MPPKNTNKAQKPVLKTVSKPVNLLPPGGTTTRTTTVAVTKVIVYYLGPGCRDPRGTKEELTKVNPVTKTPCKLDKVWDKLSHKTMATKIKAWIEDHPGEFKKRSDHSAENGDSGEEEEEATALRDRLAEVEAELATLRQEKEELQEEEDQAQTSAGAIGCTQTDPRLTKVVLEEDLYGLLKGKVNDSDLKEITDQFHDRFGRMKAKMNGLDGSVQNLEGMADDVKKRVDGTEDELIAFTAALRCVQESNKGLRAEFDGLVKKIRTEEEAKEIDEQIPERL